jgi:hypothetical protein
VLSDTLIEPSTSLVIGTVISLAVSALIAWLVLVVAPRHLTDSARRWAERRWRA